VSLESLGLVGILALVLALPFSVRQVEEELELFLLAMGALAVSLSGQWSTELLHHALTDPLPLAAAVLGAGILFRWLQPRLRYYAAAAQARWGERLFAAILVLGLGLLSAFVTAIIAALLLAELLVALRRPAGEQNKLAVLACFSIGLGSGLTPLGGPLASIATSRLSAEPYHAGFWFMANALGPWALALMLGLALVAWSIPPGPRSKQAQAWAEETWSGLAWRGAKAYLFVAGLVLLGQGFAPAAERWLLTLPTGLLYWANLSSAVLDNATLAAAEVGPHVAPEKLKALLMGLMISGGMLIPGNVPNIVCASKLKLRAKDWARFGVPLGLALMLIAYLPILLQR
jgi:predicted cation transporter